MHAEMRGAADAVKFYDAAHDFLLHVCEADSAPREIAENRLDLRSIARALHVFGRERMQVAALDEHARRQIESAQLAHVERLARGHQRARRSRHASLLEAGRQQVAIAVAKRERGIDRDCALLLDLGQLLERAWPLAHRQHEVGARSRPGREADRIYSLDLDAFALQFRYGGVENRGVSLDLAR